MNRRGRVVKVLLRGGIVLAGPETFIHMQVARDEKVNAVLQEQRLDFMFSPPAACSRVVCRYVPERADRTVYQPTAAHLISSRKGRKPTDEINQCTTHTAGCDPSQRPMAPILDSGSQQRDQPGATGAVPHGRPAQTFVPSLQQNQRKVRVVPGAREDSRQARLPERVTQSPAST